MAIDISQSQKNNKAITSVVIAVISLGLAYAPIPGVKQTVVVVSGTELAEPLQKIEAKFEKEHPNINLELKFQGSQDIVNNFIDEKNDFKPTVLIPASTEFLDELQQRFSAQDRGKVFARPPQAIAKTLLVAIAWQERGKVLFPDDRFSWDKLERAIEQRNWQKIGGKNEWGSFDLVIADPTRSNSGQITLNLWATAKLNGNLDLNNPAIESLFSNIKKSVYQPPRSTDILLQEFISRGANDADVATVYESIALYRWQQSKANQGKPYQIYYLDPTIFTTATAAILRPDVSQATAKAASKFIDFLTLPEQQKLFVEYGFRSILNNLELKSVANSPWNQNIPGAQVNPQTSTLPTPKTEVLGEIKRLWERVR
jgi:ABC-type molybdate transport system substrate-binding protein